MASAIDVIDRYPIYYSLNRKKVCLFFAGKCRQMMEEEEIDNTMNRFLDMITQSASEKLWMLDLGDDNTDDNVNTEDIKYGVLASNESNIEEIEKDFKEMKSSINETATNSKTKTTMEPRGKMINESLKESKLKGTKSIKIKEGTVHNTVNHNSIMEMKDTRGINSTTLKGQIKSVRVKQKYLSKSLKKEN